MHIIQAVIGAILYLVIFFSIGFILNMLLKKTWTLVFIYPIFVILMIDNVKLSSYVTETSTALASAYERLLGLQFLDIFMLGFGLLGAILAGVTIRFLRKSGYSMF
ncbi:YuiB family protein [Exiguobacterium alkaliphilum]|uniref:YuiB family protein n=1 Tax=Exiguobacterium alkaliphilum TaxID=1428684 RepID=UPI0034647569